MPVSLRTQYTASIVYIVSAQRARAQTTTWPQLAAGKSYFYAVWTRAWPYVWGLLTKARRGEWVLGVTVSF